MSNLVLLYRCTWIIYKVLWEKISCVLFYAIPLFNWGLVRPNVWTTSKIHIKATVYFILVCHKILGNNSFYYFLFLAQTYIICVNIFFMYSYMNFQLDPTIMYYAKLLLKSPLRNLPSFAIIMFMYIHDVDKSERFLQWGNSMSFVASTWNFVSENIDT